MKNDRTKHLFLRVMPYLVLLVIHMLLSLRMEQPTIFPDEAGYLSRARYISGISDIIQGSGFFHFGYSLFLLPAFWLFSDPGHVYSAVMVINALLMSSLYFGLVYILHILFECPKRISSLIAFTCCLYPACVLQANLAWSENAFIPFYAVFLAAVGTLVKEKSWWAAFLFGFASSFLYTVHPRALLILPVSILFLFILAITKTLPKFKAFFSSMTILSILLITRYGNDFLSSLDNGRTVDNYIKQEVFDVLSPSNWGPLALTAGGQILYLIEATYGLFFIGIVYICMAIWKKWSNDRLSAFGNIKFSVLSMLLVSSAAILIPSSAVILRVNAGDDLIYGRYNEGFLALYVAFGLVAIYQGSSLHLSKSFSSFSISVVILLLSCVVLLGYDYASLIKWCRISNVNVINIFGVYPFIGIFRRLDLLTIALITILLMFILIYVFRIKFVLGVSLLMTYFIAVTACGYTVLFFRSEYIKNTTMLKHDIGSLGDIKALSYDRSYFDRQTWLSYQYFLPNVVFDTFYSAKNQLPKSRVVVSGNDWRGGGKLKAKLLAVENSTADGPPIIRKLIELFFDKPLEPEKRINQALWLVKQR